jgi:hypothetical protein
MENNAFVNIIGDITESSERLMNDFSGEYSFLLQDIIVTAINERKKIPGEHQEIIMQALLSASHVIDAVTARARHKLIRK